MNDYYKMALYADRYRWLREHAIFMVPASRDNPTYPQLCFSWDIWNEHPKTHNAEGLDWAIDLKRHLK